MAASSQNKSRKNAGRLKIGNDWNAITIIALSQTSPLKMVAELVENSIDAKANHITITRFKRRNETYLQISDDGNGVPTDAHGKPDFHYVATHICDSFKRRLHGRERTGIQGEFGIGLLSFWVVGERLTMVSAGADGNTYQMEMVKGEPEFIITQKNRLIAVPGTEVRVGPLLSGARSLTGDKIQRYLSRELRDRIRSTDVKIAVIDRRTRTRFLVEPQTFTGQYLHHLPEFLGDEQEIHLELYLTDVQDGNQVALFRNGTRVLPDVTHLEEFNDAPWNSGRLQGVIDVPFLTITPGTRDGIILDGQYGRLLTALAPVRERLLAIIAEQRRAEEEKASRDILKSVQKALQEAFEELPREEYDWFDIYAGRSGRQVRPAARPAPTENGAADDAEISADQCELKEDNEPVQREFFEFPGPLYTVAIAPRSSIVPVGRSRRFRAICRDRSGREVTDNLHVHWCIADGDGILNDNGHEGATFTAAAEPGIVHLTVAVIQGTIQCSDEAVITVTDQILPDNDDRASAKRGLPGYTYRHAPGELWRALFDEDKNIVVINSGHRDFIYASRNRTRKLRYISRLFAKELILKNFMHDSPAKLLERMVELSLYTEEHLK